MTIKQLIDKLQVLSDNLESSQNTPILTVEYAYVAGGVQVHIGNLNPDCILFQQNLDKQDLIFIEPGITSGVVLGFIPKYEIKEDRETEIIET